MATRSNNPAAADLDSPKYFISRELSWLEFNDRVLREAWRSDVPLLERVKFTAIASSNLDEFFMVRVAGLCQAVAAGDDSTDLAGMTPRQQLEAIGDHVRGVVLEQSDGINGLIEQLAEEEIFLVRRPDWNDAQRISARQYFEAEVRDALSPIALLEQSPPPLLAALRLHVVARLRRSEGTEGDQSTAVQRVLHSDGAGGDLGGRPPECEYVVLPIPRLMRRLVPLPLPSASGRSAAGEADGNRASKVPVCFGLVEDVIIECLDQLFPRHEVAEAGVFRITRDSDVRVDEDENEDLLENIQAAISERNRRQVVRLEVHKSLGVRLRDFLKASFALTEKQIYQTTALVDATGLFELASLSGREELKDPKWPPQPPSDLRRGTEDIFAAIRQHDLMLSLPYEQFDPVIQLVQSAADDPAVLAIRMVLYRTTGRSPLVGALIKAAERGKQVTVLVELKARFDEAQNVEWARRLEDAGCDVIYGIAGFKTHAKILLIVRREEFGVRRYAHLGTGNYNDKTAKLYSDVGVMTCNDELTGDVLALTNLITGLSQPVRWNRLAISPGGIRQRLEHLIDREIQLTTDGLPGRMILKMNSIQCPRMCKALYRASQAGVRIDMNVRGICCLRPQVPDVSENIRVHSIVDRFLEHARIFYFYNGGHEEVYVASADWMIRNLDKRVETMFPVIDQGIRKRLLRMLETYMSDNTHAWRLGADGAWQRVPTKGEPVRAQEVLYRQAVDAAAVVPDERLDYRPRRKQRESE